MADRLESLGDPGLRQALLCVRRTEAPTTADDLATRLGIHRSVARGRLERLAAAGLLRSQFERQSGRSGPGAGRPAKTYRVSPELSGVEFPRRYLETLVSLLAAGLPRTRLRAVGVEFGRELARTAGARPGRLPGKGLNRACEALRSLGYQITLEQVEADHAVLTTSTCPLRPLIVAHPETAAIDEGMWTGLVGSAAHLSTPCLTCRTSGCLEPDGACRVELTFKEAP